MRAILFALITVLAACSSGSVPGPKPTPTPTPSPTPSPCAAIKQRVWLTQQIGSHVVHIFPSRQYGAYGAAAACTGYLQYHGGPIQAVPRPYLIFWGDWTNDDPDKVQPLLIAFYNAMFGSLWLNTATQYSESDGKRIGNNPTAVTVWSDPALTTTTPSDTDLGNEAAKAATHFGDYTAGAVYVIVMPHGVVPDGFGSYCAWHSTQNVGGKTVSFINLPYQPDAGNCGGNSVRDQDDGVTIVAGHEQAETETDPQPDTGWLDSNNAEIGDKCAWTNLQLTDFGAAGSFATQPLWSNLDGRCVQ